MYLSIIRFIYWFEYPAMVYLHSYSISVEFIITPSDLLNVYISFLSITPSLFWSNLLKIDLKFGPHFNLVSFFLISISFCWATDSSRSSFIIYLIRKYTLNIVINSEIDNSAFCMFNSINKLLNCIIDNSRSIFTVYTYSNWLQSHS